MANWFDRHCLKILMSLAVVLSAASIFWSYINGYIVVYGDAATRLNISRRVVDNLTPGFAQLGSSWPPFFHILMLPMIWNNFLWHSGLAGSIVSGLAFCGASYFMFRLIETITGERLTAFIGTLLLVLNPNYLYLQTTPMTESLFIFSVVASTYYLIKWFKQGEQILFLVFSAFFAFTAGFNRYEGWALILTHLILIGIVVSYKEGRKKAEGIMICYGYLAGLAISLWLLWNLLIFADPLNFLRDLYSAGKNVFPLEKAGLVPTSHNLVKSIVYYWWAVVNLSGLWVSLLFILGIIYFIYLALRKRAKIELLPIATLLTPGLFITYALYRGNAVIHIPQAYPHGMFNIRFALSILPAIAAFVALLAQKKWWRKILVSLVLAAQLILFSANPVIITLQEPLKWRDPLIPPARYLKENYNGGLILASAAWDGSDIIMLSSGISMKNFIYEGTNPYWSKSLKDPSRYATWIVIKKRKEIYQREDKIYRNLHNAPVLNKKYVKVFDKKGVYLYRLREKYKNQARLHNGRARK